MDHALYIRTIYNNPPIISPRQPHLQLPPEIRKPTPIKSFTFPFSCPHLKSPLIRILDPRPLHHDNLQQPSYLPSRILKYLPNLHPNTLTHVHEIIHISLLVSTPKNSHYSNLWSRPVTSRQPTTPLQSSHISQTSAEIHQPTPKTSHYSNLWSTPVNITTIYNTPHIISYRQPPDFR